MPIYCLRTRPFEPVGYFFAHENCKKGDTVLVQTDSGMTMAEIISGPVTLLAGVDERELPKIERLATDEDHETVKENEELALKAFAFCKSCIEERKLDMKLVNVEVFFDRSKYIFYFTAPNRIDFRELVKDLVREYRARIELRQIGVRHETQMIGAIGNCGRACCCRCHLRKFAPVTIKMAKEQNLFLNPSKISGICGRLLCCLSYEQENYDNFRNESPRAGKKYQTARGVARVLRSNMFKNTVSILMENNEEIEMDIQEWKALKPRRSGNEGVNPGEEKDMEKPGYYSDYEDDTQVDLSSLEKN